MSKARELLTQVVCETDIAKFGSLLSEIRAYLADTNPSETINNPEVDRSEPVAWAEYDPRGNLCALHRSFGDGLSKAEIKYGWKLEPLYLHPAPQRSFVRLNDKKVMELWFEASKRQPPESLIVFARAIEDALEEKNK